MLGMMIHYKIYNIVLIFLNLILTSIDSLVSYLILFLCQILLLHNIYIYIYYFCVSFRFFFVSPFFSSNQKRARFAPETKHQLINARDRANPTPSSGTCCKLSLRISHYIIITRHPQKVKKFTASSR